MLWQAISSNASVNAPTRFGKATAATANPEEHWLQAEREMLGSEAAPRTLFPVKPRGAMPPAPTTTTSEKFGESGRIAEKVKKAKAALDGPEREELKRAEEAGKRRAKGVA